MKITDSTTPHSPESETETPASDEILVAVAVEFMARTQYNTYCDQDINPLIEQGDENCITFTVIIDDDEEPTAKMIIQEFQNVLNQNSSRVDIQHVIRTIDRLDSLCNGQSMFLFRIGDNLIQLIPNQAHSIVHKVAMECANLKQEPNLQNPT